MEVNRQHPKTLLMISKINPNSLFEVISTEQEALPGSNLVYLLGDDHGVVAPYLLRAQFPVVERAVMLVAVSM